MMKATTCLRFAPVCCALLIMASAWLQADEIFLRYGKTETKKGKDGTTTTEVKNSVKGRVDFEKSSPEELVYSITKGDEKVDSFNVEGISFDGEPQEFGQIRGHINNGSYGEALEVIKQFDATEAAGTLKDQLLLEANYWKVWLPAKRLIEGSVDQNQLATIGGGLAAFVKANPNYYRLYEAQETMGQMLMTRPSAEAVNRVKPIFGALATSKSKEYALRGKVLMARAMVAANDANGAIAVLGNSVSEAPGENRLLASQIGQARVVMAQALAVSGKADEALKQLQAVIDTVPSSDAETHGRAYLAMGNILLAKQSNSEALYSFLKVDLLTPQVADIQAENLARLAKLWTLVPNARPEAANDAKERLQSKYPYSIWKGQ
jgi:predicted negative regulator of RcsB-dependent stress response